MATNVAFSIHRSNIRSERSAIPQGNRLSPPYGFVSLGNGSTFYAGYEVPRPWGWLPQTPLLAAARLEGDGGKAPITPDPRLFGGRQSRTKRLRRSCGRGTPEGPPAFLLDCSSDVLNEGIFAADAATNHTFKMSSNL